MYQHSDADKADVERVCQELELIRREVEHMTELPSRWNGNVIIDPPDTPYRGLKPFHCAIHLRSDLVNLPIRWRTLIHESLHAVSQGYNQFDYNAWKGWEEAVVEQLQRLLRGDILKGIGVPIDETLFLNYEENSVLNPYIAAVEDVRVASGENDAKVFYIRLLRTPIKGRYSLLISDAMKGPHAAKAGALLALSKANSILSRRLS